MLRADRVQARPELETIAEGNVEFRRAGTVIRADRISYDSADDRARARGNVRISRDGNHYWGPELELQVQRFEGFFLEPQFTLGRTGAGGTAQRFEFLDPSRFVAVGATYTSCPRDGSGDPDWLLTSDRVRIDLEANEGVAEGAVLRFLGVPILGGTGAELPAHRRAQVRLVAAGGQPRFEERSRTGGALLLEHRTQPRCDHHAERAVAPRCRPGRRVSLSRAKRCGPHRGERAAG